MARPASFGSDPNQNADDGLSRQLLIAHADKSNASSVRTLNESKSKSVQCHVITLQNTSHEIYISRAAVGQELFDAVVNECSLLQESAFFSLSYEKSQGLKFWLKMTKKIEKQVQSGLWVFNLEVKFYPPEPNVLSLDETRYQLVLQVRQDILKGRLPCSFHTLAVLGSYTIQSELGDYDLQEHGEGMDYLRSYMLAPTPSDELLTQVAELHRLHKGLKPPEADLMYLDTAKKLALYGVDLHKAKQHIKGGSNKEILVGVSPAGLYIYDESIRMHAYKWPRIIKISYKHNVFRVKTVTYELNEKKEEEHIFKCATPALAKRLWRISVETHQFFRLKHAELTDTNLFSFTTRKNVGMTGPTLYQVMQRGAAHTQSQVIVTASSETSLSDCGVESEQLAGSLDDHAVSTEVLDEASMTAVFPAVKTVTAALDPTERSTQSRLQMEPSSELHDHNGAAENLEHSQDLIVLALEQGAADHLLTSSYHQELSTDAIEPMSASIQSCNSTVSEKEVMPLLNDPLEQDRLLGTLAADDAGLPIDHIQANSSLMKKLGANGMTATPQQNFSSKVIAADDSEKGNEFVDEQNHDNGSSLPGTSNEGSHGITKSHDDAEEDAVTPINVKGSKEKCSSFELAWCSNGVLLLPAFSSESSGVGGDGELLDISQQLAQTERSEQFLTGGCFPYGSNGKILLSDVDASDDQALLDAIRSVLDINLDFAVDKIELVEEGEFTDI